MSALELRPVDNHVACGQNTAAALDLLWGCGVASSSEQRPSRRTIRTAAYHPALGRRGRGGGHPRLPPGPGADQASGALPARLERLLLPDASGRVLHRAGVRLLRAGPAPIRA